MTSLSKLNLCSKAKRGYTGIMTKRKGPASGDPRCVEGGRKGGLVNVAKGRDFKELGRLGGQATIRLHGAEHMHRIRPQRTRKESQGAPETQD